MNNIGYGIRLKVWGDYACFTRPEMKVERVSYDVMTPSAARGILDAIYWKPAISWVIDKIHVMKPIKFDNIRRNEVLGKIPSSMVQSAIQGKEVPLFVDPNDQKVRVQRAALVLRDVCYYIEAHFEMTDKAGPDDTVEKHYNVALRRMRKGQCYHHPYFGCREFPVRFELIEGDIPKSSLEGEKDFGIMLWDINFTDEKDLKAVFFRARMKNGVINVKECRAGGIYS